MAYRSNENLIRSDSAESLHLQPQHHSHQPNIRQVIPKASNQTREETKTKQHRVDQQSSPQGSFITSTYGNWQPKPQRKQIVQQVDIHRAPDLNNTLHNNRRTVGDNVIVPIAPPVPLPRRSLIPVAVPRSSCTSSTPSEQKSISEAAAECPETVNTLQKKTGDQVWQENERSELKVTAAKPMPQKRTTLPFKENDGKTREQKNEFAMVAVHDRNASRIASPRNSTSSFDCTDAAAKTPKPEKTNSTEETDASTKTPSPVRQKSYPVRRTKKRHNIFGRQSSPSNRNYSSDSVNVGRTAPTKKVSSSHSAEVKKSAYTYEKLIGINIHETCPMLFDYSVRAPMVRCSVWDVNTGQLLAKSDPKRSAVLSDEPDAVDFLQPLISKECKFKNTNYIECIWEELLLINEDIAHIQTGNEIIFFEIISIISKDHSDFFNISLTDGWQYICWAFLRPGDVVNFSHIDRRCRLQLYEYRKPCSRSTRLYRDCHKQLSMTSAFEQWRNPARQKYRSTLDVTVRSFRARNEPHKQMRRPQNVLQSDRRTELPPQMAEMLGDSQLSSARLANKDINAFDGLPPPLLDKWKLLPGQRCPMPNRCVTKLQATGTRGSLVSRFNPTGNLLAVAVVPVLPYRPHDILVVSVPDGRTEWTLSGHSGLVYGLDWKETTINEAKVILLLSVSADRTAIIWCLTTTTACPAGSTGRRYETIIFPHPCFLYAGLFVDGALRDDVLIATGGRDGILRIWSWNRTVGTLGDLLQELPDGHTDRITAVVISRLSSRLYTADWSGRICEWTRQFDLDFQLSRRMAELQGSVRQMRLLPNGDTLLVLHNDASVLFVNVPSGQRMQSRAVMATYSGGSDGAPLSISKPPCFGLSGCGSLLLLVREGRSVHGWSLLDGSEMPEFRLPMHGQHQSLIVTSKRSRCHVTSIDFSAHSTLCSLTVFAGKDDKWGTGEAGVFLLGHKTIEAEEMVKHSWTTMARPDEKEMVRKVRVEQQQQADLNRIIQRIDEIFARPQNKTDDVKCATASSLAATCDAMQDVEFGIEMQRVNRVEEAVTPPDSLTRSGTYVLKRNEQSNRTFILPKERHSAATLSRSQRIDGLEQDADDATTVSESM